MKEKEEILKRLGVPDDASPGIINNKIAELRQICELRARIPAKRKEAEEWLAFLDHAESALHSQPTEEPIDKVVQPSKHACESKDSTRTAEEKWERESGQDRESLRESIRSDGGISENAPYPVAHDGMLEQDQPSSAVSHVEPASIDTAVPPRLELVELLNKPASIPWWLMPGTIIALLLAPLLIHLKSSAVEPSVPYPIRPTSPVPALLRLGLYDWPSAVMHYSIVSNPGMGIELTTVHQVADLIPAAAKPAIPFDMVVVPFSAAVENSKTIRDAGWKLVWVCDESNGMDRILVNRNVKNDRARVVMGKWLTLKGTSSAHVLDAYLDNTAHAENKRRYKNEHYIELDTAEELLERVESEEDSITAVAIHEPWSDASVIRENENNLEDDTSFAIQNHRMHEINVLLVRTDVLNKPELLMSLVKLVTNLLNFPSSPDQNGPDATKIFGRDPQLRSDFSFAKMDLNSADEQRILSHDVGIKLKDNLEFLFGFGPFSCTLIAEDQSAHISWPDDQVHSPCNDLIDKAARNRLISELQKTTGNQPKFDENELADLCGSDDATELLVTLSPFVLGKSDPALPWKPFISPAMQLSGFVGSSLNPAASYCILGHGDASGTPEWNQDLGRQRADRIKELLASHIYRFASQKLVTVSRGNEDPLDAVNQDSNRRVEIRQIQFEIWQ